MSAAIFIRKLSYFTSRNYVTWLVFSYLVFVPATLFVIIKDAIGEGLYAFFNHLIERDFAISWSLKDYRRIKVTIEKSYQKYNGR